ncbi:MAG: hypothetical protein IKO13_00625, partial [Oscillospiraceae bacterium]|nr:hypothetical protein [Oscillospiraceae bacterium]
MLIKKQGQVMKRIMHLLTMVIVCLVFTGNSTAAAASVCGDIRLSVKHNEEEPPQPQISKTSEVILNQAFQDLFIGNYEDALEQFEKLGNHLDAEKYAAYARARIKERDGFPDEAIELYTSLEGFLDSDSRIAGIQDINMESELQETKLRAGDHVFFGHYEQDGDKSNGSEEIEWRVLEVREDRVLVISEYGLDVKPYNSTYGGVTWETCSLRKWLNGDFLTEVFTEEEQEQIRSTKVENK